RLESVRPLRSLLESPYDLFNGMLQNLSLKALPAHQIIALRLPTLLMLASSIVFIAASLYIKYRNRYLPYTYLILCTLAPLIILLSHQAHLPGMDLLFFGSLLTLSLLLITSTSVRASRKRYFLLGGAASLAMLTLQPLGLPIALILAIIISRSTELRYHILSFKKLIPVLSIFGIILILALNVYITIKNRDFIKITSGLEALKNYSSVGQATIQTVKSIFGLGEPLGFITGTNRPDFLLIGALTLTAYEVTKKRQGRATLLIIFAASILISGLYAQMGSIVIPAVVAPAIVSLVVANMIRIIDVAFPFNPYPRNTAKVLILLLISVISSLSLYTFTSATIRQNTPQTVNLKLQNYKKE
ncbi:MAG: hypothetical protein QG623_343, partial [Patescibacteria group bacterium]|nr:hypothetical protein [Patescibacteria group bacterium]